MQKDPRCLTLLLKGRVGLQAHLAQIDDQVLVVVVVEHRGDLLMAVVLVVGYPVGQP